MENLKKTLRWIAFPFSYIGGILVGAIIVLIITRINIWWIGGTTDGMWYKSSYWIFSPLVSGYLGIFWGAKTAPSNRKIVSLVLLIISVILAVLMFLGYLIKDEGWVWPLLGAIALCIGSGIITYNFFEKGDDFTMSD